MKRYILTGAPGSGKTVILRQLELEGFAVVEEAATDVIALAQANGNPEPHTDPAFLDAITSLQKRRCLRAARLPDKIQFHDRSVICTAALATYLGFVMPASLIEEIQRIRDENMFENRVFFLQNLGFIARTEARRITFEETLRFERVHEQTYRNFGFEIIYVKPGSVADRVATIKSAIGHGNEQ